MRTTRTSSSPATSAAPSSRRSSAAASSPRSTTERRPTKARRGRVPPGLRPMLSPDGSVHGAGPVRCDRQARSRL
ncbi:hypothetical protein N865_14230 [Intrasporangium oryzae NRRL B-24470]|uniref:Uncharacterized protein n=1 Tax=Intrasporangium oryzae NRRL B-24470 TaxID=1386089 RepID=W9G712_9MICO|nr:hypothetical protein N865_14230 [Intrasporangium oryzae NRRL B-24470]